MTATLWIIGIIIYCALGIALGKFIKSGGVQ